MNVAKKGEMLRPVLAADVATSHLRGVGSESLPSVLVPQLQGVAAVRVVRLRSPRPPLHPTIIFIILILILIVSIFIITNNITAVFFDGDGETLVVAAGGSLQDVETGESGGGDAVELADDAVVAGAWEVEEEGDAVGPAHQRVVEGGPVAAEEDGVSGGDELLHEAVVGEPSL
ncbi:hypothetical protein TIFTF001_013347 [Ficus carica]|uniref:Uncharacterized protein n=1 Tax=Ficus carica TaxID=3494 RepID=A0AA88A0S2_FICCA|nr:hypothetical protein TIFTF001_013347 [Ficus carica]